MPTGLTTMPATSASQAPSSPYRETNGLTRANEVNRGPRTPTSAARANGGVSAPAINGFEADAQEVQRGPRTPQLREAQHLNHDGQRSAQSRPPRADAVPRPLDGTAYSRSPGRSTMTLAPPPAANGITASSTLPDFTESNMVYSKPAQPASTLHHYANEESGFNPFTGEPRAFDLSRRGGKCSYTLVAL